VPAMWCARVMYVWAVVSSVGFCRYHLAEEGNQLNGIRYWFIVST